jgi:hypothetical protein
VDGGGPVLDGVELRAPDQRGVAEDPDVAALAPGVEGVIE